MRFLPKILAPLAILALTALPGFAAAPPEPLRGQIEKQFRAWLEGDIWNEAKAAGISRATFDKALGTLTIDWSLPELVLPGEKADLAGPEIHPEFNTPGAYFNEKILADLASQGRRQLKTLEKPLAEIEARFGIPKTMLLAFWGRETSFGEERQPKETISAMATQAFLGKRRAVPREQMLPLLEIVQRGWAEASQMRGSWAGAMGQPQLLPSDYLKFAVDFDGDGRRDIWKSAPDSLATMAGFIAAKGWKRDLVWGVEAKLPQALSCILEGFEQGRPASEWAKLGITTITGAPLPNLENPAKRFLLLPAGRLGPAFIISENFYRMKEYNNSDLYALFVGQVSDRIAGGGPFKTPFTAEHTFSRAGILSMQEKLAAEGLNVGTLDGLIGFRTRIAIGQWQGAHKLSQTCYPDAALLAKFK